MRPPLAAVQLLPGRDASRESLRSGGLPYAVAATFLFPPENLITLLVPGFFGDIEHTVYWGRWFLGRSPCLSARPVWCWPSTARSAATAATPLLRADGAAAGASRVGRLHAAFSVSCTIMSLVSTNSAAFRFVFFAAVFLTALAGVGMDRLIRQPCHPRRLAAIVAGIAVLLGLAAAAVHFAVAGKETAAWWQNLVHGMGATARVYFRRTATRIPAMFAASACVRL